MMMMSFHPSLVKSAMTGGETGWQESFVLATTTPSSPETTVSHCHPTTSTWSCEEGGEEEKVGRKGREGRNEERQGKEIEGNDKEGERKK